MLSTQGLCRKCKFLLRVATNVAGRPGGIAQLSRSLTAGIETFELNWPTPRLSTFAVVTPNKVPNELQLAASHLSEWDPRPAVVRRS